MDKELIERLAREACFEVVSDGRVLSLARDEDITRRLTAFAALVAENAVEQLIDGGYIGSGYADAARGFIRERINRRV